MHSLTLSDHIFSVSSILYIIFYSILYSFIQGGQKLDHYLTPHDKFIWATEGNPMKDCYQPSHPMSKTSSVSFANKDRILTQWLLLRYYSTNLWSYDVTTTRILPSWACLFSAVSHPHLDTSDSLTTPTLHCFPVAI